ncbi:hypothetical protein V8F20_004081 [Naviculisporaceae sp. PSN 640]
MPVPSLRAQLSKFDNRLQPDQLPSRRFLNQLVLGVDVVGQRNQGREKPGLWDWCRESHSHRTGMCTCWETKENATCQTRSTK